jgi:Cu/Ag efflux pump CusA
MSRRAVLYRPLTIGFFIYALAMLGIHLASFWPPAGITLAQSGSWLMLISLIPFYIALFIQNRAPRKETALSKAFKHGFVLGLRTLLTTPVALIFLAVLGYAILWLALGFGPAFGHIEGQIYEIRAWSIVYLLGGCQCVFIFRERYAGARRAEVSSSS